MLDFADLVISMSLSKTPGVDKMRSFRESLLEAPRESFSRASVSVERLVVFERTSAVYLSRCSSS